MSTIKADTIVASDGTSPVTLTKQSAAKAWIAFNGTGTIAIKDSNNFTSISDDGTGDYKSNLASALSDANGSATAGGGHPSGLTNVGEAHQVGLLSSSQLSHETGSSSGNLDFAHVNAAVHGDLA
tara:strand:+ start:415 stop:789 length:375 start_codon:yes stop_codon:yes gene_type:complete